MNSQPLFSSGCGKADFRSPVHAPIAGIHRSTSNRRCCELVGSVGRHVRARAQPPVGATTPSPPAGSSSTRANRSGVGTGQNGCQERGTMSGSEVGEALLAAVAQGHRDALAQLYARNAPWLQVRLARRCADQDAVAEALQDTFVAVWRSAGRWSGRGDVGAWLWGIAVRRLVDVIGHRRGPVTVPGRVDEPASSAEELVLMRVEHSEVAGALNRLS